MDPHFPHLSMPHHNRSPYTRLFVEKLGERTMFDVAGIDALASFDELADPAREMQMAEWRQAAEETQRTVDSAAADYRTAVRAIAGFDQHIALTESDAAQWERTAEHLRVDLRGADGNIGDLEGRKQATHDEIALLEATSSQLRQDMSTSVVALGDLREVGIGLQEERAILEQELDAVRHEHNGAGNALAAMQEALTALERSMGEMEHMAQTYEAELATHAKRVTALEESAATMTARLGFIEVERAAVKTDMATQEARSAELQGTIATQSQGVGEAERAMDDAKIALDAANASVDGATLAVEQQTVVVANVRTTLAAQEATYASLKQQYDAALRRRPRSAALERSLTTQMKSVQTQIAATKTQLQTAEATLQTAQAGLAAAQTTRDTAAQTFAVAQADWEGAHSRLENSILERARLSEMIVEGGRLLAALEEEAVALRAALDTATAQHAALAGAMTQVERSGQEARRALELLSEKRHTQAAAMPTLAAACDELRGRHEALESRMDIVRGEIARNEAAVHDAEGYIASLERVLASNDAQCLLLQDELRVLEGDLIGQWSVRDAIFASLAETETERNRTMWELATFLAERSHAMDSATSIAFALEQATAVDRRTDDTLAQMIAIDEELDAVERRQTEIDTVVRSILAAKAAMQSDDAAIWTAAREARIADLQVERAAIATEIDALPAGLLAEPSMVTPSVRASTAASSPGSIAVDAKDLPGGMTLSMGYGGRTWQHALAAGSSVTGVPIAALGHDGRGGLAVSLKLKDAGGTLLQEYEFWISGGQFIGDPRSYASSFPALAHPGADPTGDAQRAALRSLLRSQAQNAIALEDVADGITLAPAADDPRVAVRYAELLRQKVSVDRGIADDAPAIILSRSPLAGTEASTPSVGALRSPSGTLEADMRGTVLHLFDPVSLRIVTAVELGGPVTDMAWSSDGSTLAFTAGNRVGIVSVGGKTVQWCQLPDSASAVEFLPSGDIAVGLGSGGLCLLTWRNGTLVLAGTALATPGVRNLGLDEQGLLQVMTAAECLTVLTDASRGAVSAVASAPEALPSVSGFERFSYAQLGMVYATGSGHAMMAEAGATVLGTGLYSMQDIDRLATQFCPEFYGATPEEVDAKLRAWASAHGVDMDFARGERLKAYQRLEEGIETYRAIVTDHYLRAFWIVHDLLTNPADQAAMQKKLDILYGAGGGQIVTGVWTPQLPAMRDIFSAMERNDGGIFDRLYNAATGVNAAQSDYWSWRGEANVGGANAGNNEGSSTPRQLSSRLQAKISAAVGSFGGGHAVIAGKTYTLAELQRASSAGPSTYAATALRPDPTTKDPDELNQGDLTALFAIEALKKYLPADIFIGSTQPSFTNEQWVAMAYASDVDIRGVVMQRMQANALKRALNQYRPSESAAIEAEFSTRSDTWAGEIFLGILQEMKRSTDPQSMANAVEWTLGISAKSILELSQETPEVFTRGLRRLFENAGYDYLFSDASSAFAKAPLNGARVDKDHYDGGVIKLTWDLPADIEPENYLHANIYLIDAATGAKIDENATPIGGDIAALSTSIHVSKLRSKGIPSVAFKIVLWKEGELQSDGLKPRSMLLSERFTMQTDGDHQTLSGDYSTLPNTAEFTQRRTLENVALSALKNHFPVSSGKTWQHTLGSGFHLGEERAAMDFNASTGGNTDEDLPVTAIAEGTIENIGLNYGSVRVRHTATINGEARSWYSTYMHMRLEQVGTTANGKGIFEARDKQGNILATLTEGQRISAGSTLGGIGGRGLVGGIRSDYAFNTHLHLLLEDDAGQPIHAGKLLEEMGVQTYALSNEYIPHPATGQLTNLTYLSWNDEIDEWVEPTHKIIFDQEASGTGQSNVWIAWHEDPSQRKNLVWSMQKEIGNVNGIFRFRDANNPSKYWNGSVWIDCQLLP